MKALTQRCVLSWTT